MNNQKNNKNFVLDETLRLLGEQYRSGLYEFLYRYEFSVYQKMRQLEDTITDNFDNMSISELKSILSKYWKLHVESAKRYESEKQLNFNVNDVKKEINNELNIL